MGDWQRGALSGENVIYLVGMQNGGTSIGSDAPPTVEALERWTQELDFEATHLLLDPDWIVIERYWDANPNGTYSQAVTAIMDRGMKIRRIGDTYDTNHNLNLSVIQDILNE